MRFRYCVCTLLLSVFVAYPVSPQAQIVYRFAAVALADDPDVRTEFEDGLVAKLREYTFDAVTSYDIVPKVTDVDNRNFIKRMTDREIVGVFLMRPAAVGSGSSLESLRDEIPPDIFRDMSSFAGEVSSSGQDELFAVVHLAIYMFTDDDPILISAGATWLDEEAEDQDEAIERLQDLVVLNLNSARPAIRQQLGLPPLEE